MPRSPDGDNSIQEFGDEATRSQRLAAEPLVATYLAARTEARWGDACPYLQSDLKRELSRLVARSKQLRGKGCATILGAIHPPPPASIRAQRGPIELLSVRVEAGTGFAIYQTHRGDYYYLPIVRNGTEWKVGAINATPLLN